MSLLRWLRSRARYWLLMDYVPPKWKWERQCWYWNYFEPGLTGKIAQTRQLQEILLDGCTVCRGTLRERFLAHPENHPQVPKAAGFEKAETANEV